MNPYKILNVSRDAAKSEIIRSAGRAMRERKYPVQVIAQAQKALLDPVSNKAEEFINFINIKPLLEEFKISRPDNVSISGLEYKPVLKTSA